MVREAESSKREERVWNRLFPTHSPDVRYHDTASVEVPTAESADRLLIEAEQGNLATLGRVALLVTAGYTFNVGFKVHGANGTLWVVLELLLYTIALGSLVSAFAIGNGRACRVQTFVAIALAAAIAIAVGHEITLGPNYATDVMAFAHGGGEILLEGNNPYTATPRQVNEIADRFDIVRTSTADGGVIDWLISYPAMHVLTFTTFLAAGFTDLRWGTLLVELVALTVVWRFLSPKGKLLAPLVLLVEPFLTVIFTGGGVTDWLWVLPVALTAVSLHQRNFGYAGIALGLACAVKQHPWFVVPFVLIWVIQTLRSEGNGHLSATYKRDVGGFLSGLIAGFVVPNLPFVLWDARSWAEAVLSPAFGDMVADGHGLGTLLGLPRTGSLVLIALAFTAALTAYALRFDRLQDLLWVLPPIVMFVSYRSLHSYFVFWIPIALLWLDLRFIQKPSLAHPKYADL